MRKQCFLIMLFISRRRKNMSLANQILHFIDKSLLGLIAGTSCIYILPIIFVKRFHTTNNILTGNVCVAAIMCGLFWIFLHVIGYFYRTLSSEIIPLCVCLLYFQVLINTLLVYSLVMVTINRYLTIIYRTKPFFKKRIWAFLSIAVHWFVSFLISIPKLVVSVQVITSSFEITIDFVCFLVMYRKS